MCTLKQFFFYIHMRRKHTIHDEVFHSARHAISMAQYQKSTLRRYNKKKKLYTYTVITTTISIEAIQIYAFVQYVLYGLAV